jgi:muramoyltetrapeptide carboxypeptidase LdcA involved in peptidoglycan recycling
VAVLFGRAKDFSCEEKVSLDKAIQSVIAKEFGRPNLAVVTNMDFGHTDPQFVLPLGANGELDCGGETFRLIDPWLS